MIINLNVKIIGGPRTPLDVQVYGTAVNDKIMRFANGKTVSETQMAEWIRVGLTTQLREIQIGSDNVGSFKRF